MDLRRFRLLETASLETKLGLKKKPVLKGASIIRIGFGVNCTISIKRNPKTLFYSRVYRSLGA